MKKGLVGRYTLERELGRGGMATVYLARDLKHDRPVALKVMHPELAATLGPERFLREIRTTARLDHPHISPCSTQARPPASSGTPCPTCGGRAADRLRREVQLPVDVAVELARQVALRWTTLIAREWSIVISSPRTSCLVDGGPGRRFRCGQGARRDGGRKAHRDGLAVGTPAYMSPEQASGGAVDAEATSTPWAACSTRCWPASRRSRSHAASHYSRSALIRLATPSNGARRLYPTELRMRSSRPEQSARRPSPDRSPDRGVTGRASVATALTNDWIMRRPCECACSPGADRDLTAGRRRKLAPGASWRRSWSWGPLRSGG